MKLEMETKWLKFILVETKSKTEVYSVVSKCDNSELGVVKWYPRWRHYCFFTDDAIVYSDRCLLNIHNFVRRCNAFHSLKKLQSESVG